MSSYKFTYAEKELIKSIARKILKSVSSNVDAKLTEKEREMVLRMAMLHQTDDTVLIDVWKDSNPNMTTEESKYVLDNWLSNLKWQTHDTRKYWQDI